MSRILVPAAELTIILDEFEEDVIRAQFEQMLATVASVPTSVELAFDSGASSTDVENNSSLDEARRAPSFEASSEFSAATSQATKLLHGKND